MYLPAHFAETRPEALPRAARRQTLPPATPAAL